MFLAVAHRLEKCDISQEDYKRTTRGLLFTLYFLLCFPQHEPHFTVPPRQPALREFSAAENVKYKTYLIKRGDINCTWKERDGGRQEMYLLAQTLLEMEANQIIQLREDVPLAREKNNIQRG